MVNYDVPFVENTEDDQHCLPAAYLMIMKYFEPHRHLDWSDWSEQMGYEPGKATWAMAGPVWFRSHGYDVLHYSSFDYPRFIEEGANYLRREFGEEVGNWQIQHSNIALEQKRAATLIESGIWHNQEPTIDTVKRYLAKGYLGRCMVNSLRLNGRDGYVGHSVVVSGFDDDKVTIQDPGLSPQPNREVGIDDFEAAWAYPNAEAKELDLIHL